MYLPYQPHLAQSHPAQPQLTIPLLSRNRALENRKGESVYEAQLPPRMTMPLQHSQVPMSSTKEG